MRGDTDEGLGVARLFFGKTGGAPGLESLYIWNEGGASFLRVRRGGQNAEKQADEGDCEERVAC